MRGAPLFAGRLDNGGDRHVTSSSYIARCSTRQPVAMVPGARRVPAGAWRCRYQRCNHHGGSIGALVRPDAARRRRLIQVVAGLLAEKRRDTILHLAASGLEAALGFWVLAHPLERVIDLVVVVAIFLLVGGLMRLGQSLATRSPDRGWTATAGLIALVMGICVWLRWPDSQWWFVGLCIAIDFLLRGMSFSVLALAERKPKGTQAS